MKKNIKKLAFRIAGTVILVSGLVSHLANAAEFTMKMGVATVNDVQTYAIQTLSKRIEERSDGRIKTELYPGAQLGTNSRMIEGLQFGTLEFYVGPYAYLVGVDPRYQVTDAPGIFRDLKHAQQTLTDPEFNDILLGLGSNKGLVGLGTLTYGSTAYATKFSGENRDDFSGKKVRVLASELERKGAGILGATAVPIDFSEISTALQQGTIDGVKSAPVAFSSLKLYDLVKDITAIELDVMAIGMFASKSWFDTLPEDLQKIVKEEAAAIVPELWEYSRNDNEKAYSAWIEHGGVVHKLPVEEQDRISFEMKKLSEEILGGNDKTKEIFNLLLKVSEKH